MGRRRALCIAGSTFDAANAPALNAAADAEAVAAVLADPEIGGYQVMLVVDRQWNEVREAIDAFYAEPTKNDVLLLYLSCHGQVDDDGDLYFAMPGTRPDRLSSTSVEASFINKQISQRQDSAHVVVLDCCFSGAFGFAGASEVNLRQYFKGENRTVLTATTAIQEAWDMGGGVFTQWLVRGLAGEADVHNTGRITANDLFEYVSRTVKAETGGMMAPVQISHISGSLAIADNPWADDRQASPTSLPSKEELAYALLHADRTAVAAELAGRGIDAGWFDAAIDTARDQLRGWFRTADAEIFKGTPPAGVVATLESEGASERIAVTIVASMLADNPEPRPAPPMVDAMVGISPKGKAKITTTPEGVTLGEKSMRWSDVEGVAYWKQTVTTNVVGTDRTWLFTLSGGGTTLSVVLDQSLIFVSGADKEREYDQIYRHLIALAEHFVERRLLVDFLRRLESGETIDVAGVEIARDGLSVKAMFGKRKHLPWRGLAGCEFVPGAVAIQTRNAKGKPTQWYHVETRVLNAVLLPPLLDNAARRLGPAS